MLAYRYLARYESLVLEANHEAIRDSERKGSEEVIARQKVQERDKAAAAKRAQLKASKVRGGGGALIVVTLVLMSGLCAAQLLERDAATSSVVDQLSRLLYRLPLSQCGDKKLPCFLITESNGSVRVLYPHTSHPFSHTWLPSGTLTLDSGTAARCLLPAVWRLQGHQEPLRQAAGAQGRRPRRRRPGPPPGRAAARGGARCCNANDVLD